MRILHVTASFNPVLGGTVEAILNLIIESNKLSIESEIVCLDRPDASFIAEQSLKITALNHTNSTWQYSPHLLPWLTNNLGRFDTVIMHGLWLYPSYAVSKAVRRFKTNELIKKGHKMPQFFIFPHGMLDPYFQRISGRKIKALRNWIYWKLIEHDVVREADGLLFTCEMELLLARKTFRPYQPKHEINIGYGIKDPPAYSSAMKVAFLEKCPEVNNQRYLLFLSRINYKKGVDLLIQSYASILKTRPEAQVDLPRLIIAGPGLNSPFGEILKQLVLSNSLLRTVVSFPGMLTGDSKWGAIYGCEAFVLPSHQENFGIAVVEALACGKPVLISDQVNIWREIERYGSGIIANDTLEGTQQSVEKWLGFSNHEKRNMATKARNTFEKCFQIDQVISRLNAILKSI